MLRFIRAPSGGVGSSEEQISLVFARFPLMPVFFPAVFYDDDLTDALFKTLFRLAHRLKNACTAILSVEKR